MSLTLRLMNSGTLPNGMSSVPMKDGVLTIGRGEENDLSLPDPDRLLSKRHCVIEERAGDFVIIDFSTNGTFLNYGSERIGQIPTPLSHGDVVLLGAFELVVDITSAQAHAMAAEPLPPAEDSRHAPVSPVRDPAHISLDDPLDNGAEPWDAFFGEPLDAPGHGSLPSGQPAAHPGAWAPPVRPSDPLAFDDPLGRDDPLAPGAPLGLDDPFAAAPEALQGGMPGQSAWPHGASEGDHRPTQQDFFPTPSVQSSLIPDDWDDLLPPAAAPQASPAAPAQQPVKQVSPAPQAFKPVQAPFDDPLDGPLEGSLPELQPEAFPDPLSEPAANPFAEPLPEARAAAASPAAQAPAPLTPAAPAPMAAAPAPSQGSEAAARAFLAGAGAGHLAIPAEELEETMARMGRVFAALVAGMREILLTRAAIKSEMRMNRTMISSGGNNPLKFSISPEQAVEAMIRPSVRGYLDAETAAAQALADIRAHEIAMMSGMEAALRDLLMRLDPNQLSLRIESSSSLGGLLGGKKARYWEAYEKMYAQIARETEDDFQAAFGREFARAYEEQLKKL
ncbi:type VI secretion system-associated FHA domain protein TagH [Roseibium litorale]|uniref:Type VI secretion system-associated FHA domain protein TagH n=1 Tax=Roseibium litorale TaxID=2803841 RepID=A0ABR9CKD1_9HYPH|nr:type VI secretion system-associated FHA domain protein TagH [Roseibium litorale]MBD8891286.1 type VI secretion system-associated FHA domain protein TagH [Roseibium litorale]